MQTSLNESVADPISSSMTSKTLRQWSAPEVILVVTNLADEPTLLFHAVRQAQQSHARILLVHVAQPARLWPICSRGAGLARQPSPIRDARLVLERIARRFQWIGIYCDPFLLQGRPSEEIPALAKFCCVDRVIATTHGDPNLGHLGAQTIAEQILPALEAPICIIGRRVRPSPHVVGPIGRMTLALSLRESGETALRFACRFAQNLRSGLTVMHVFPPGPEGTPAIDHTPNQVTSRLSARVLREAELLCPLEVVVREGDPAVEVLKHESRTGQDFIILNSPGSTHGIQPGVSSVTHQILSEARSPVIVLNRPRARPPQSVASQFE